MQVLVHCQKWEEQMTHCDRDNFGHEDVWGGVRKTGFIVGCPQPPAQFLSIASSQLIRTRCAVYLVPELYTYQWHLPGLIILPFNCLPGLFLRRTQFAKNSFKTVQILSDYHSFFDIHVYTTLGILFTTFFHLILSS